MMHRKEEIHKRKKNLPASAGHLRENFYHTGCFEGDVSLYNFQLSLIFEELLYEIE